MKGLEALALGGLAQSSLLLAGLAVYWVRPTTRVIGGLAGFGAGALISAVAFDLVPQAEEMEHWESALWLLVGAVIFVVAMLLTGNTWKALGDLHRAAPVYSQAMRDRWRSLEAARARGEEDAVVGPLPARPQSYISYFELRQDPAYWENWSVAHYFGLRSVRLGGDTRENP